MNTTHTTTFYKRLSIILGMTTFLSVGLALMSFGVILQKDVEVITNETANSYVTNYKNAAAPVNAVVESVLIEAGQIESFNQISRQNAAINTFRMYFGEDNTGKAVAIVVGINAAGEELSSPVLCSARSTGSLCPPMCDVNSNIGEGTE